ncbi:hypothetical protein D3C86_1691080 [compost metagenome]
MCCVYEVFRDRQPEPMAANLASSCLVLPVEPIEYTRKRLWRDAHAVIPHLKREVADAFVQLVSKRDVHVSTIQRIFDRVIDEDHQQLC